MPLETISAGNWIQTRNTDFPIEVVYDVSSGYPAPFQPYKLHLGLFFSEFLLVKDTIIAMLNEAAKNKIIQGYKYARHKPEEPRIAALAFTIYLLNNYHAENIRQISMLCYQLQTLLRKNSRINPALLTACDLQLSPHLFFRLSSREGKQEYVPAIYAPKEMIQDLAIHGKRTQQFKDLHESLTTHYTKATQVIDGALSDQVVTNKPEVLDSVAEFFWDNPTRRPEELKNCFQLHLQSSCRFLRFTCNVKYQLEFKKEVLENKESKASVAPLLIDHALHP